MSIFITAQLIGFLGYLFYISAPHFKTQTRIIQVEAISCTLLGVQWLLLDLPSLLVVNVLVLMTSLASLYIQKYPNFRKFMVLLYPIGFCALIIIFKGTVIDVFSLIIFCFVVASKSAQDIKMFRLYATGAGVALAISGVLALSLPAVIFNIIFCGGHLKHVLSQSIKIAPKAKQPA